MMKHSVERKFEVGIKYKCVQLNINGLRLINYINETKRCVSRMANQSFQYSIQINRLELNWIVLQFDLVPTRTQVEEKSWIKHDDNIR